MAAHAGTTNYVLGTSTILVGPDAGTNSVELGVTPDTATWEATTNAPWLHLSPADQSGTGRATMIFSYDSNPGATRSGTLTIAGQTLTITQAGSTYIAAGKLTPLVTSGLNSPWGVAVDATGNVYISDTDNNAIKEWTPTNDSVTTLVSSGLAGPTGVAVDAGGNVYFTDTGNNAIKEWTPTNGNVTVLVSSELLNPFGVAVDRVGNVYFADWGNNAVKEWAASDSKVSTIILKGELAPFGVAVDVAGNVIFSALRYIYEWTPPGPGDSAVLDSSITGSEIAVDGSDNWYVAANGSVLEGVAADSVGVWLFPGGPAVNGVAVDGTGNVYIADTGSNAIFELPRAFVDPTPISASALGGNGALPVVLPITQNLLAPFAPASDQPWLSITGITNGVVSFAFDPNPGVARTANIQLLGQAIPITQGPALFSLATNEVFEPPQSGTNSVFLTASPQVANWTAVANVAWLHVSPSTQSGTGSSNVVFSFDGNLGPVRSGTLTIAGQTLTVTQAAGDSLSTNEIFVAPSAGEESVVLTVNSNLGRWSATANDSWLHIGGGNASGTGSRTVRFSFDANPEPARSGTLTIAGQTLTVMQSGPTYTLGKSNLVEPNRAGSADVVLTVAPQSATWTATANASWLHLSAANEHGTGSRTVHFSFEANPEPARTGTLTIAGQTLTVVQSGATYILSKSAFEEPDRAGSADVVLTVSPPNATWTATANASWLHLNSADENGTGSKTVHFSFDANPGSARSGTFTIGGQTLVVVQGTPDYSLGAETLLEGPSAGLDSIVLAVTPFFSPWEVTTHAEWLHVSESNRSGLGSTNVIFGFDANRGPTRSGTLTISGQILTVTQAGANYVEAGTNTLLAHAGLRYPRGAVADAAGNVYIVDQLNDALQEWIAATNGLITLVTGLGAPAGLTLDGAGNVYIAEPYNTWDGGSDGVIAKWMPADNTLTTLIFSLSEVSLPCGVAVDKAGNVYIADTGFDAVVEWTEDNSNIVALVPSYLNLPLGVAVDAAGNVYIADTDNYLVREWMPENNTVTNLVSSGLNGPAGVAVDGRGNVYIADSDNSVLKKWTAASNVVTTIVPSGLVEPFGVSVDGSGNVFIADTWNAAVEELPHAFVDPTPITVSAVGGTNALPAVLPVTQNLRPPFAPYSDQPWLAITGMTNGVVHFSYQANPGSSRIAHISLLGQTIPITQEEAVGTHGPKVIRAEMLENHVFRIVLGGTLSGPLSVLSTTNLLSPLSDWQVIGTATNTAPEQFEFCDPHHAEDAQRFYRVRCP